MVTACHHFYAINESVQYELYAITPYRSGLTYYLNRERFFFFFLSGRSLCLLLTKLVQPWLNCTLFWACELGLEWFIYPVQANVLYVWIYVIWLDNKRVLQYGWFDRDWCWFNTWHVNNNWHHKTIKIRSIIIELRISVLQSGLVHFLTWRSKYGHSATPVSLTSAAKQSVCLVGKVQNLYALWQFKRDYLFNVHTLQKM